MEGASLGAATKLGLRGCGSSAGMVLREPGVLDHGVQVLHGVLRAERRRLRVVTVCIVSCERRASMRMG